MGVKYINPLRKWKDDLLAAMPSTHSGVILLSRDEKRGVVWPRVVRRAKPDPNAKRISPDDALNIARLANLRMWDAYETIAHLVAQQRMVA